MPLCIWCFQRLCFQRLWLQFLCHHGLPTCSEGWRLMNCHCFFANDGRSKMKFGRRTTKAGCPTMKPGWRTMKPELPTMKPGLVTMMPDPPPMMICVPLLNCLRWCVWLRHCRFQPLPWFQLDWGRCHWVASALAGVAEPSPRPRVRSHRQRGEEARGARMRKLCKHGCRPSIGPGRRRRDHHYTANSGAAMHLRRRRRNTLR